MFTAKLLGATTSMGPLLDTTSPDYVNGKLNSSRILQDVLAYIRENASCAVVGPTTIPMGTVSPRTRQLVQAAANCILMTMTVTGSPDLRPLLNRYVTGLFSPSEIQYPQIIATDLLWAFTWRHGI
jgi:hypothetical protein